MFKSSQNINIDISWQSFFRFFAICIAIIAAWYFRQIIFIALLGFILASLLDKPIDYLEVKWKNRWLATFAVYLIFLGGLGLLAFWLAPAFNTYLMGFKDLIPSWMNKEVLAQLWKDWQITGSSIENFLTLFGISKGQIYDFLVQFASIITKILGGASTAFFVLLFSFFINTEKKGIEKAIRLVSPKNYEDYFIDLWGKTRQKVSSWFLVQLTLSGIVGGLALISFKILGISHAELLAILTALFDFIPYIGPIIIGLIAVLVGMSQHLLLGVTVLIVFIVIQAIEGFVSPLLRAKTMKLNPLVIIIALLVGGKLAGFAGIIIALPLAAAMVELIRDIHSGRLSSYLPQKQLL
ncbi:MAG: AI-2E family transporter [Candidatus Pacebacteria bacterium]|nr:AI-2E family transporter [Candidatus Paceibacterota bacterium]